MTAAATPEQRTRDLLTDFATSPGRSVFLKVLTTATPEPVTAEFGVHADTPRPAASLLKLPLALAAETTGLADDPRRFPIADITLCDSPLLHVLSPETTLTAAEIIGITIGLSDNDCARWLLDRMGIAAVRDAVAACGCTHTAVAAEPGRIPLVGTTTARDAVRMIERATDAHRFPITERALRHNIHASRIPLGVTELDVEIAHKGGHLTGVSHDAALLECTGGQVLVAFLTDTQHDTVVTGYEMGLCTRGILQAWGLAARRTTGLA